MSQERLTSSERAELCDLPDRIGNEWTKERARRCRETQGPPRTITTGHDPLDQAYGDR